MPETTKPLKSDASIPDLLKELRDESSALLRQEVALAKQEMAEKTSAISSNAAQLIAGGLVAYCGAVVLFLAIAAGLYVLMTEMGMSHLTAGWLSPLIVGGALTAIGYGLVQKALNELKSLSAVPERTVDTVQTNAKWAKEKVTP